MNMKHDFSQGGNGNVVYVRRVPVADLPDDLRQQVPDIDALYALHGIDGARLALVRDRRLAFALARENELTPVSVH